MASSRTIAETDLSHPVCAYLEAQGYTVRGEVHHCDIAAVKGEELIIIELKCTLNLTLLAQGIQRQQLTDSVYVAIRARRIGRNGWHGMKARSRCCGGWSWGYCWWR